MNSSKGKRGFQLVQFCPKGHDTFITGRNSNDACKECRRIPIELKKIYRFCPNGHDKNIVGRNIAGTCKECRKKRDESFKLTHPNYSKNHKRERLKKDLNYKLICNLRSRLHMAIKNKAKKGSAIKDLGCTIEEFRQYIESKFYGNMAWDNWGKVWHLDHVIPLINFDLEDLEQFRKANNYSNLQPLTIENHIIKSSKELTERAKLREMKNDF